MDIHQRHKEIVGRYRKALYNCNKQTLQAELDQLFVPQSCIHLSFPFEDLDGPKELYERAFDPLLTSLPDLERRDFIVIAGPAETGNWVGCAGYYIGIFEQPWLDIPATLHPVTMRYCEFFRLEDERIVEMQALWDIPHVMMQARGWPMAPSLGVDISFPVLQPRMVSSRDLMMLKKQKEASDWLLRCSLACRGLPKAATRRWNFRDTGTPK